MGMLIDGPVTTEALDTSGEILELKGLDISEFNEGTIWANFEHENKLPETSAIGKFVYAHKIFKESDCENERQKDFWRQIKIPFLYAICELMDDPGVDHPGAVCIAAMLRFLKKKKEKITIGFSVEGSTLKRDGHELKRTIWRKTAVTLRPCNRQCLFDILDEKDAKDMLEKCEGHAIQTVEVDCGFIENLDKTEPVDLKIAMIQLQKSLEAGMGNAAPSMLTQGSALQREDLSSRKHDTTLRMAVRKWNGKRPLKEFLKASLPEVSDDYIDTFVDLAHDLTLKKHQQPIQLPRVGPEHAPHPVQSNSQQELVDGLYLNNPENNNKCLNLLNDHGDKLLVRIPSHHDPVKGFSGPQRSTIYYDMAHNYFGMGPHVPTTNYVEVPDHYAPWTDPNGRPRQWRVTEENQTHPYITDPQPYLENYFSNKSPTQRLFLTDYIMGVPSRHQGEVSLDSYGNLYHNDNDKALTYLPNHDSIYMEHIGDDLPLSETSSWAMGLDPKMLIARMMQNGVQPQQIRQAVHRLNEVKNFVQHGTNFKAFLNGSDQND